MVCKNCGESMEGDGHQRVIHCPNADSETYDYSEPDSTPVMCEGEDNGEN